MVILGLPGPAPKGLGAGLGAGPGAGPGAVLGSWPGEPQIDQRPLQTLVFFDFPSVFQHFPYGK